MSNISYCRFEKTLEDLKDCNVALEKGPYNLMNEHEYKSMLKLVELCDTISENYNVNKLPEQEWTKDLEECDCSACDKGDFENCEG